MRMRRGPGCGRPAAWLALALATALPLLAGCAVDLSAAPDLTPSATPSPEASVTQAPEPVESPEPTATPDAGETDSAVFESVVDGDTIRTSAGTVRIIGIDTPELGQCGHDEASGTIGRLVRRGDTVVLELPPGQNDRDRYDRLLRYVSTTSGVDIGLAQLEAGNAVARYDSTDGYPWHPREAAYHAAQVASLSPDGGVVTTSCQKAKAAPPPASGDRWWEKYTSCTKLKRNTVGDPTGPFRESDPAQAEIYDWFAHRTGNRGDGDGDGLACE